MLFGIMGIAAADPVSEVNQGTLRDTHQRIRYVMPPFPTEISDASILLIPVEDTATPITVAPPLKPPGPEKNLGLSLPSPPELTLPWLTLSSPFSLSPTESLSLEAKTVRDFPKYWVQLETLEGVDDLRRQLGMQTASGAATGIRLPGLGAANGKIGFNALWLGSSFWQAWHKMSLEKQRRSAFEAKVNGLMGYAQDLGTRKNSGPAISLILARLDFMKKKATGKLPSRPERQAFTEPLKAWAANPLFDSTRLGTGLLDICGIYEEMTN